MDDEQARMQILEMVSAGKISAEEGIRLLEAMRSASQERNGQLSPEGVQLPPNREIFDAAEGAAISLSGENPEFSQAYSTGERDQQGYTAERGTAESVSHESVSHESAFPEVEKWRRFWMIPFWIGVGITVFGGLLMFLALQAAGIGFWFVVATLPFIFGLVVMVLGWLARTSIWLHLRVEQKPGSRPQRIAISMPLPISLAAWFFRTFGERIPNVDGLAVENMLQALQASSSQRTPIYIQVGDEEDEERVEIMIG
jgi:hypothetical protein